MSIFFTNKVAPVGLVHDDLLGDKINLLKLDWDASKTDVKTWWKRNEESLIKVISFLLSCADALIIHVQEYDIPGQDKKATVLKAISVLYVYVIIGVLPLWLKPFASTIQNLVINIMISYCIDFIVSKYKTNLWKSNEV